MLITNLASNVDTAKAAFSWSISCAEKYIEAADNAAFYFQ